MDKFDRFIANLDEILKDQRYKLIGDATIGYYRAIHVVRNAAWTAKCAADAATKWTCDVPGCVLVEKHGHAHSQSDAAGEPKS